jgi:hypothetical protein
MKVVEVRKARVNTYRSSPEIARKCGPALYLIKKQNLFLAYLDMYITDLSLQLSQNIESKDEGDGSVQEVGRNEFAIAP